jgi:hypothetical protein
MPFDLTVTALDPYGNVDVNYTGTVTFTSSDSAAQLPDDYPFPSNAGGVAVFTITLNTSGEQTVTATDISDDSITGTATILVGMDPGGHAGSQAPANHLAQVPMNWYLSVGGIDSPSYEHRPLEPAQAGLLGNVVAWSWNWPGLPRGHAVGDFGFAFSELDPAIVLAKNHAVLAADVEAHSRARGAGLITAGDQASLIADADWGVWGSVPFTVREASAFEWLPGWFGQWWPTDGVARRGSEN